MLPENSRTVQLPNQQASLGFYVDSHNMSCLSAFSYCRHLRLNKTLLLAGKKESVVKTQLTTTKTSDYHCSNLSHGRKFGSLSSHKVKLPSGWKRVQIIGRSCRVSKKESAVKTVAQTHMPFKNAMSPNTKETYHKSDTPATDSNFSSKAFPTPRPRH